MPRTPRVIVPAAVNTLRDACGRPSSSRSAAESTSSSTTAVRHSHASPMSQFGSRCVRRPGRSQVREHVGGDGPVAGDRLEVREHDTTTRYAAEAIRTEQAAGVVEDLAESVLLVPHHHQLRATRHERLGLVAEADHDREQLGLGLGVAAVEAVEHRSEEPDVRAVHGQVQLAQQHAELRHVTFELGAFAVLQREQAPVHGHGEQTLTRTTATTDRPRTRRAAATPPGRRRGSRSTSPQ